MQYVAVRIASIERKAAERGFPVSAAPAWELLASPAEKELAVKLLFYPETLKNCARKHDCSGLVEYLLGVAKAFNRFYRDCPVLAAEDLDLAAARLALASAVRRVIVDGLATLTISVPEGM